MQWCSQPKNWGAKVYDFRRITLFCLEKRLSKYKILFSLAPPGYAYVRTPLALNITKISALQVRISEENTLNATTQQFITAKISG